SPKLCPSLSPQLLPPCPLQPGAANPTLANAAAAPGPHRDVPRPEEELAVEVGLLDGVHVGDGLGTGGDRARGGSQGWGHVGTEHEVAHRVGDTWWEGMG
ncbi:hypothetical protein DV515_00018652, partial [Chloebia gouldiae]